MCYTQFENEDKVNAHMNEKHSPESFYEKLVEDISGCCRICKKSCIPSEIEEHCKNEHNLDKGPRDSEVNGVIEDVLNKVIDLSDNESDLEDEDQTETEDEEINIYFEHSVEEVKCEESYKGKKPLFVQCVKSLKKLFTEKGDIKGKVINKHNMVVKDARDISYGIEADVEISVGKLKGLTKVKIWGPSKSATKKNQCTIIISRYQNSDPKFATMMSRKIIKPLLESFTKGLGWKDDTTFKYNK